MLDYLTALSDDSGLFAAAARAAEWSDPVPSCPGWTVADLVWHLTEVQGFWASIVETGTDDPSTVDQLERPPDVDLLAGFGEQSARLRDALSGHDPDDRCWSWDSAGGTTGWVRRRQAHEALIHRIDAELAVGGRGPVDPDLAADGVDELLRTFIGGLPDWASFTPDGTAVRLESTDTGTPWNLVLGRFTGTSPTSGNSYDEGHAELVEGPLESPTATVRGSAADLDLWLWGRSPLDRLAVDGDPDVVHRLRRIAAEVTQ